MPHIRFTLQVDCDDDEPSRLIPPFRGEIFEYEEDSDEEVLIGHLDAYLVLRGRAINEHASLFEGMDSVNSFTLECFEALFDPETEDWNQSLASLYHGEIFQHDVLLIERLELDPTYRGKGIGAQVVRETIATVGSSCGLVACKPFALQYEGWMDEENRGKRSEPGFEARRLADFAKVEAFWSNLGFRNVPGSRFYTLAPDLTQQPMTSLKKHPGRVN